MAIEKEIKIIVTEQGTDQAKKKVDSLTKSTDQLTESQQHLGGAMKESGQSVLDNGGAMGLLNAITGGTAQIVKDSAEAMRLFAKESKIAGTAQAFYTTIVGTSTGAMKLFRLALISTGIGAIVVALGLLIANFDKVKKAVLSVVPGLATVGKFIGNLVDAVTDFIGVTSDATRELDRLTDQANKTLDKNKFFLDAYGDKYDEYTKRKIEANNKYAEQVKAMNEDETLDENEKLRRLKLLRERADREIIQADKDREDARAKKREEAFKKEQDEAKRRADERKKAEEERQKAIDEENKRIYDLEQERLSELNKQELALLDEIDKARRDNELNAMTEQEAELARIEDAYAEKLRLAEQFGQDATELEIAKLNDINNVNLKYQELEKKQKEEQAEKDKKREEDIKQAKIGIANQTVELISQIAGKGSKLGKAIAIANAVRSGIEGVQNAYTTAQKSPITTLNPAYPYIQAGLAGAFSAVQVAKLLKDETSTSSSSVGGAGGGGAVAPSFNLVRGTGANQIAESLAKDKQPIKAYVTSGEMTTAQQLDRNIVKASTL